MYYLDFFYFLFRFRFSLSKLCSIFLNFGNQPLIPNVWFFCLLRICSFFLQETSIIDWYLIYPGIWSNIYSQPICWFTFYVFHYQGRKWLPKAGWASSNLSRFVLEKWIKSWNTKSVIFGSYCSQFFDSCPPATYTPDTLKNAVFASYQANCLILIISWSE